MLKFEIVILIQVILYRIFFDVAQAQTSTVSLMRALDTDSAKIYCNAYHCNIIDVYNGLANLRIALSAVLPCGCLSETNNNVTVPTLTQKLFELSFNLTNDPNCFGPKRLLCDSKEQTSCVRKKSCNAPHEIIELGKLMSLLTSVYRCVEESSDPKIKEQALQIVVDLFRSFACCPKNCKFPLTALKQEIKDAVIQLKKIDNRRCLCATSCIDYCNAYHDWYNWSNRQCHCAK